MPVASATYHLDSGTNMSGAVDILLIVADLRRYARRADARCNSGQTRDVRSRSLEQFLRIRPIARAVFDAKNARPKIIR